ncbi:DNA-processing protein DprA [Micrococcales bacterium 31B]|nr:DNA-processing protein DprA [Micrococcales bacterium 31B]
MHPTPPETDPARVELASSTSPTGPTSPSSPASPAGASGPLRREREARLVWNHLAEGEDPLAWVLIHALGAADALSTISRGGTQRGVAAVRAALEAHCDSEAAARAISGARDLVEARVERWVNRVAQFDGSAVRQHAAAYGARLVIPTDPGWSPLLDDLGTRAPLALWVVGDAEPADVMRSVALVGSRASTHYGEAVARDVAVGLVERGWCVVSGGAYGIDAQAHRGALAAMPGAHDAAVPTVAVLAGGVDVLYPRGNSELLRRVARHGALFSETPLGGEPMRHRFLKRNRLIAALAGATVVVEASHRSGALSTARHALDLLRPLGAVPGPVTSLASVGCHGLLREGRAVCVTNAAEVTELVQLQPELLTRAEALAAASAQAPARGSAADRPSVSAEAARARWDALDDIELRIVDHLSSRTYAKVGRLAAATGLREIDVAAVLARLEMHEHVIARDGAYRRARSFDHS